MTSGCGKANAAGHFPSGGQLHARPPAVRLPAGSRPPVRSMVAGSSTVRSKPDFNGLGVQHDDRVAGPLRPFTAGAAIGDAQRAVGRLQDDPQELALRAQRCGQFLAASGPRCPGAPSWHRRTRRSPGRCRSAAAAWPWCRAARRTATAAAASRPCACVVCPAKTQSVTLPPASRKRNTEGRIPFASKPNPAAEFVDLPRLDPQPSAAGRGSSLAGPCARSVPPGRRHAAVAGPGELSARRPRPQVAPAGQPLLEVAVDDQVLPWRGVSGKGEEDQ